MANTETNQVEETLKIDEKVEKSNNKRKRCVMNDNQVAIIEKTLIDEPDMRLNLSSLKSWAGKLSQFVSFMFKISDTNDSTITSCCVNLLTVLQYDKLKDVAFMVVLLDISYVDFISTCMLISLVPHDFIFFSLFIGVSAYKFTVKKLLRKFFSID